MRRTFVAVLLLSACGTARDTANYLPATAEPRQLQALRLVIESKPVQWISTREECVVPFDARDARACAVRPATTMAPDTYRAMRTLIPVPISEVAWIRCARLSREINDHDSVLVSVTTMATAAVDTLPRRHTFWVWFRHVHGLEAMWMAPAPASTGTDTMPVGKESQC